MEPKQNLTFLIHSQNRGSSTEQRLHHRSQAITRCKMEGPGQRRRVLNAQLTKY